MRIVAIRTRHLAGGQRVGRDSMGLAAFRLVAGEADISLGLLVAHLVTLGMHLVAGVAGHIVVGMRTSIPVCALVALVAIDAGRIAIGCRRMRILAEAAINHRRLAAALVVNMLLAFAVAIDAGWSARIALDAVTGGGDGQHPGVQFEHGCLAGRLIGLVMAAGAFRITLEDEVLGIRLDHQRLLRRIGGQHRCRGGQSADDGTNSEYLSHKSHLHFP